MTTMNHPRIGVLLLALALLASACGGGSATSTVASASDSSETDNQDPSDEPANSDESASSGGSAVENGATPMAASSPIGAFFSEGGGFESALAEYTIKVEEEIVLCMAAQGFEFARSGLSNQNAVQDLQNELTQREWTSEYGYGISTSFDSIAQSQASDPNAAIIFGLSESEREVWIATLAGESGFAGPDADAPLEEQGCVGQALIETGGQEALEGIETFGSAYEEREAALFDRREMVEVVDAWSRCMSEAGYTGFAERGDPESAIGEEFETVTGPMSAALDELSEEEGQALISGESLDLADLPDLDLDALRDLQKREIEMALADLDCYEAEVKATYEPLRDDFENGLLVDYATEFNALKNIGT